MAITNLLISITVTKLALPSIVDIPANREDMTGEDFLRICPA
jgi:hypothetical protein